LLPTIISTLSSVIVASGIDRREKSQFPDPLAEMVIGRTFFASFANWSPTVIEAKYLPGELNVVTKALSPVQDMLFVSVQFLILRQIVLFNTGPRLTSLNIANVHRLA